MQLDGPVDPDIDTAQRKGDTHGNGGSSSCNQNTGAEEADKLDRGTNADEEPARTKNKRRKRKKLPPTEFLQAITVELENGLVVTGTYASPTTKGTTLDNFLTGVLNDFGLKQVIVGDLNARHRSWDKNGNQRGVAVHEVVNRMERTYIVAAAVPSYFKAIRRKRKKSGGTDLIECSSNPDIGISRIQNTTVTVEEKNWRKVTDHRPLLMKIPASLTIRDVRKRVSKALFHSATTKEDIKHKYSETIPNLVKQIKTAQQGASADDLKRLYKDIQQGIVEPWEKTVRARPPGKPVWWHKSIGVAQIKRRKAAKKWHDITTEAKHWTDNGMKDAVNRAAETLKEQKTQVRKINRQAKAKFEQGVKQRLHEAGITEQSRAVRKDRRGKALRQAEASKRGKQLRPAEFTRFMGQQQGGGQEITPQPFKVDSRKFRRRIKRAIKSMEKNKAVGTDNIHAEMLQTAPDLFASLITQWWILVGQTGVVPDDWNTGIMVPLFKKGDQQDPSSYRPLCMLSHVRKIIEKAVIEELEEITTTDRMQFGFQSRINTLQAAIDIASKLETSNYLLAAILDLTKAYDRVSRQVLVYVKYL